MMVMKAAALLWLPVVCLGEAPRASLLQLGSLSKRGATLASVGEARGFSSTLAGFQKYTDQLVDTYMRDGVAPGDTMKDTIALIVNYINIDMFNALVMLHHADLEVISECAPCDESHAAGNQLLLGRTADTQHNHACARQRMCGMAAWGTDASTFQSTSYQNLQYSITASTEGREQTVWRLRDETAILRRKHKDCVIENTQHDQKNDLSCRQYNKYRGALKPETNDPRNKAENTGEAVAESVTYTAAQLAAYGDTKATQISTDYQDGSPRNIFEEVVLDGESKNFNDAQAASFLRTKYSKVSMCAHRTHTTDDLLEGTPGGAVAVNDDVHVKMSLSDTIGTLTTADRLDDGHRLGKVVAVTGTQCVVEFPQGLDVLGLTLTSDYSTRHTDQFTDLHGDDNTWTGPCGSLVKAPTDTPTRGLVESPHDEHTNSIFWTECCENDWSQVNEKTTLGSMTLSVGQVGTADACPHQRSPFGLTYNPPSHSHGSDHTTTCETSTSSLNACDVDWSADCNHVDNFDMSAQATEAGTRYEKYMSLYPECATSSGSAWKKIVQPVSCDADPLVYRVDGRRYTNWDEGDLSKQMVMAEDAEARKVMEVCLEAVNHWFQPIYHYYVQCTHNDFHTYHEACKPDQNKYEEQACLWRETEDSYCDDYKDCIETEAHACTEGEFCESLEVKVKARKADYETGQRIICLLAVLISDDETEAGREVDAAGDPSDLTDADGFHFTDANGNRVRRDEAVIYSSKRERLDECKNKQNNDDGPENPHTRANADMACIPRKNSAFLEGDYTLVTGDSTVTSAAGHLNDGNSVDVQHLNDYTNTNIDQRADGVKVVTGTNLDANLEDQNNAVDSRVKKRNFKTGSCTAGFEPVTTDYECYLAGAQASNAGGLGLESIAGGETASVLGNPGNPASDPYTNEVATHSDVGSWDTLPMCFKSSAGVFLKKVSRRHSATADDKMYAVGSMSSVATFNVATSVAAPTPVCVQRVGTNDDILYNTDTKEYDAQERWQDVGSDAETLKVAEWMSRGSCQIDTEQWELEACGGATENVRIRYPDTMCVPDCETRTDGTACTQTPANTFIATDYSTHLTYGDAAPTRVATVPTLFVGVHNTETDDFSVPCSADFFLDQMWGYVNAAAACPTPENDGARTCAGATFEPAKSLNSQGFPFESDDKAGGLMLHMKMFPRPAIMRSPGRSDPLSETTVLCHNSDDRTSVHFDGSDGCKVILVHKNYFKGSVWTAQTETTFHYADSTGTSPGPNTDGDLRSDGPRGTSTPYAEAHGVADITTHADAFDIYNVDNVLAYNAKETYTAYPDHFSYEWCRKCSPSTLKMDQEPTDWVWRNQAAPDTSVTVPKMFWLPETLVSVCPTPVSGAFTQPTPCWNWEDVTTTVSTAFGPDFAGNCEGITYSPPATGDTVPYGSFDNTVPAYHPKSCLGSVAA